jgi:hypothetical protein
MPGASSNDEQANVIIAECREYHELVSVLRTFQPTITDDLPPAMFAPVEFKALNARNLGPILSIKGLKLAVFVDEPQLAKIRHRLTRRKNPRRDAGAGKPHKMRRLRLQQLAMQSPAERRRIATVAARARWARHPSRSSF